MSAYIPTPSLGSMIFYCLCPLNIIHFITSKFKTDDVMPPSPLYNPNTRKIPKVSYETIRENPIVSYDDEYINPFIGISYLNYVNNQICD